MTTNNHHIENGRDEHAHHAERTHFACPKCGEDRIDYLTWIDDDTVRCTSCGTEYKP